MLKKQFEKNGYAIIEDFLSAEQIKLLKDAGKKFSHDAASSSNKVLFSSVSYAQSSGRYFLESGDKIRYFYETDALSEDGNLKIDPELALNKVGHALHWLHPVFKEITFHQQVKDICEELELQNPVIIQSMYIYKNPRIGSVVNIHQDATYLYTESPKLYGFWFALDDATEENGCLQFIPGSHHDDVTYRFIRNPDKNSEKLCIYTGYEREYDQSEFKFEPVKKGSCVVLHGQVVHQSFPNKSDKPRHAYTFHIFDSHESVYSPENWLQTTEFHSLYKN